MNESEKQFMEQLEALCKHIDFPKVINHDYSPIDWTYSKLCIADFTDRHKFWILVQQLKTVRYYLRGKDSDKIIMGALVGVIAFCLIWIHSLYDWEKDEEQLL